MFTTNYAFFDVDETLISIKSMFSFRDFYLRWTSDGKPGQIAKKKSPLIAEPLAHHQDRATVNRLFWESFKGFEQTDVQQAAYAWHQNVSKQAGYFLQPTLNLLKKHQQQGVEPVFVSGSCIEILTPLAEDVGVTALLTNRLEVDQGKFTGKLLAPQTIGAGKRDAVITFLKKNNALASDCYAYGDDISDLPMLETVGYPRVIEGNTNLMSIAHNRGWPIIRTSEQT